MATRLRAQPEPNRAREWKYLEARPHRWKRELYVKDSRRRPSTVYLTMLTNNLSREEAAWNFDLPVEAIDEITRYCEENEALLNWEASEERRLLESAGIAVEPPTAA